MTVFDQRGQQVTYQYNAAGDINFGAVQNKADVVGELKNLQAELAGAIRDELAAVAADGCHPPVACTSAGSAAASMATGSPGCRCSPAASPFSPRRR